MRVFWAFFGPKGVFGCQDNVQKVSKGLLANWQFVNLLRITVLTTLSNLLSGNGATRIYSIVNIARIANAVQCHS